MASRIGPHQTQRPVVRWAAGRSVGRAHDGGGFERAAARQGISAIMRAAFQPGADGEVPRDGVLPRYRPGSAIMECRAIRERNVDAVDLSLHYNACKRRGYGTPLARGKSSKIKP